MKKGLLVAMMFACLTTFAQKIKIKKDKISIDDVEVAILDKQKLVYKIVSLDNRPIFSIERKVSSLIDGSTVYWSVLTDLSTNKTNEVLDYGKDQGLSFQNAIVASVCNEKYKFISAAGIDEKGVLEFINGTPTDIDKVLGDANLKAKNELKAENDVMVKAKVSVKNSDIFQLQDVAGKEVNVVIGSINKKSIVFIAGFAPSLVYEVNSLYSELDNNSRKQNRSRLVGSWYDVKLGSENPTTNKRVKNEIITWDNKYFGLRGAVSGMEKISSAGLEKGDLEIYGGAETLPNRIVAKLLFHGYTFEAMK
ncbi:hypothetical protein HNP99_000882 [Flavobacterium sp. 28A]|uniref:hypothetical protein n=1 Tax=Flavobacterium sp. 28A TaxID=2735895 RepID=UPI00156F7087|nr:hypothetical protein [Flavobacterium sp. 28A]NRT14542.1 hypothetical protein [Flavobacterium sp. 28A]